MTIIGKQEAVILVMIEITANREKEADQEVDQDPENIETIWPPLNHQYHQRSFTGK